MQPAGNFHNCNMVAALSTADGTQQDQGSALSIGTSQLLTIQALAPPGDIGDVGLPYFMPCSKQLCCRHPQPRLCGASPARCTRQPV
jgi:hypothetical protein